jgi:signal transduction histidine kinase/sensor domain CHASE-containing protein
MNGRYLMLRRLPPRSISVAALLALAVGVAGSGILSVWLRNVEDHEADVAFQQQAETRLMAFRNGLEDAEEALATVNRLFAVVEQVSRQQFRAFAQPLLARYPHIQALVYQRIVSAAERPAYEAAMRKQYPGFMLTEIRNGKQVPARRRASYRVVQFIEPLRGNETVFGLDVASVPFQDHAVQQASVTGRACATGLFHLLQDTGSQRGFSVLMPVYRHGAALDDADARKRAATGFTTAVFRADDLAEKILQRADLLDNGNLELSLYAGATAEQRNLAFHRDGATGAASPPAWAGWLHDIRPAHFAHTFDAAGGTWHLVVETSPGAVRGLHVESSLVLLAGTLISLLLAAYLWSLARRTAELARANASLTEDVAARKEVELALRRSQEGLRELAAHQERVKEDERKRIAREIHDDLGQNLLALRIEVSMLDTHTKTYPVLDKSIRILLDQIDTTMKSVRAIINNLRPPVLDLGLQAAIEWLVAQFRERSGIACTLVVDHAGVDYTLDDERATTVFRIVQESLTNVSRHARASRVEISLRRIGDRLQVTVADNGIGRFPGDKRKPRSFGLVGVKERLHALDGTFKIHSTPGSGTTLTFSIPIPQGGMQPR